MGGGAGCMWRGCQCEKKNMDNNPYSVSYTIERHNYHNCCYWCCMVFQEDDPEIYGFPTLGYGKRSGYVNVSRCCQICAEMDLAITEAVTNGWRHTKIGCIPHGYRESSEYEYIDSGSVGDERCICGAVTLMSDHKQRCVQCSIKHRMLDKAQAESRLISAVLKQLRAEVRQQKKLLINPN